MQTIFENSWPDAQPIAYRERTVPIDIHVSKIVRLAFYAFVATIPFETVDLGISVEPTVISLVVLVLALPLQPAVVLRKPPMAFLCFFFYLTFFAVPTLSQDVGFRDEAVWQLMVLVQLVAMAWIAFNLLKSERVARGALTTFALSCAFLAFLQIAGISESTTNYEESIQRTTSFGFHPNNLARILGLGLIALVGIGFMIRKRTQLPRWLLIASCAVIGLAIIETGSRGGLLALGAGLSMVVFRVGDIRARMAGIALLAVAFVFFLVSALQSELFTSRVERTLDNGDLARREDIYPTAWGMFLEKPLFGWGGKSGEFELGTRLAHEDEVSKNPHNLILYLLMATGLFGTVPMLVGLFMAVRSAWRARAGPRGVLPLALLVSVLIANMSGLWLHNKMHWFVVALALSSSGVFAVMRIKRKGDAVAWETGVAGSTLRATS